MPPTIEEVIAAVPDWAGHDVVAERIPAGLTNTNWRVVVDGTPFFVRIPGADTDLLAVDRGNEIANTVAAATAGVAPRVVQTVPDWDVFALEWLDARTMSNETLRAPGMPARIAAVLRQLHAGPRFRDDFDMFRVAERYLALVDERSIPIPAGYREHLGQIPRIEAALAAYRPASVPCHNDLLAENYLDDGARLWLVDWEYSGNNDPAFELGNTAQELGYDDAQVEELCAAYFGDASPARLARMRLQMIMSDVGWTLWAAIQARISTIEYDFTGWAEERWARSQAALEGPDFESWLKAVEGPRHARALVAIRELTPREIDMVGAVLGLARLGQGDGHYLVAWEDDEPVGHAYVALTDPPELQDVSVRPEHRRHGIATALADAAERVVAGRGFDRLRLSVSVDNDAAQALYARLGYRDVGIPAKRVQGTVQIRTGPLEVDDTLLTWEKVIDG